MSQEHLPTQPSAPQTQPPLVTPDTLTRQQLKDLSNIPRAVRTRRRTGTKQQHNRARRRY